MESIPKCNICKQDNWIEYFDKLARCGHCGLIRAKDNPSAEELNSIYQEDYFFGDEYFDYIQDRKSLEHNFSKRVKNLKRICNIYQGSTVVEVGCSYGFFLNLLKNKVKSVIGYDITKDGIFYARKNFNVDARLGSFLDSEEKDIDLVCMWDVVEHLLNPEKFIEKASGIIKPGGYLALTTGDIGSLMAKYRKNKWRMIHPPTHLFYFDQETITDLLGRYGFKVIYFSHPSVYRNIGSVLMQLITKNKKNSFKFVVLKIISKIFSLFKLDRINFGLNFFDIMEVIAVKDD